jgi:hypothetical protein
MSFVHSSVQSQENRKALMLSAELSLIFQNICPGSKSPQSNTHPAVLPLKGTAPMTPVESDDWVTKFLQTTGLPVSFSRYVEIPTQTFPVPLIYSFLTVDC